MLRLPPLLASTPDASRCLPARQRLGGCPSAAQQPRCGAQQACASRSRYAPAAPRRAAPLPPLRAAQELCCIVDEHNNVVGAEPRDKTVRECV
jgi:hypothetical protein